MVDENGVLHILNNDKLYMIIAAIFFIVEYTLSLFLVKNGMFSRFILNGKDVRAEHFITLSVIVIVSSIAWPVLTLMLVVVGLLFLMAKGFVYVSKTTS
ncbi:MAG: hypothetical protein D6732_22550 [Methanobacteriota archaeon]|nr:MAG: hypothetical protein D6732_22550 [Euryarchaeota archaeon]